ncbi:MAG: S41 family peptidase [Pseudomonadota bacterium]
MRKIVLMTLVAGLVAACGGGSGGPAAISTTDECSNTGQKDFVLQALYDWYLWNDLLPGNINVADYTTPEDLVARVTADFGPVDANGDPLDRFSFINSAQADQQFFGEGRYEGFGFSRREVATDDVRLVRVFVDSPAGAGGLGRGQRILSLNGRTIADLEANEGIDAFFDNTDTVDFEMRRLDGTEFTSRITRDIVTINPLPQWRVIDAGGGRMVGYVELATFISTADPVFATVFADFQAANVSDVIIDLRYNGGGLVSTAELLGDYLGGFIAENLTFSRTEFNADRAGQNNSEEFFERQTQSVNLSSLVVIASRSTASASELVTNSMIPFANVQIVGDRTFGKPVGQIGLEFCEKILRPTAFKTVNADGDGDYFDGLPLGAGCSAADDLSLPVGDDNDPNIVKALGYLDTGACPVSSVPGSQEKASLNVEPERPDRRGPPHREILDAY